MALAIPNFMSFLRSRCRNVALMDRSCLRVRRSAAVQPADAGNKNAECSNEVEGGHESPRAAHEHREQRGTKELRAEEGGHPQAHASSPMRFRQPLQPESYQDRQREAEAKIDDDAEDQSHPVVDRDTESEHAEAKGKINQHQMLER